MTSDENVACVRLSRSVAISIAMGLRSDPTNLRPSLAATTRVVPDPHMGSHTNPSGRVARRMMRSSKRSGFWVG